MNWETLEQTENFWTKVCFDREFKPEGRYQVYRELVTERMLQVLLNICPVAKSLLSTEQWWDLLWDFLKSTPPRSEIIRDLVYEFSEYLERFPYPHRELFPYLAELVHYEALEIKVKFLPEDSPEDSMQAATGKMWLNPAHGLARYTWPVHFISDQFADPNALPRGAYHLLLWRCPETHVVEFMEINPLVAEVIKQLQDGPLHPKTLLQQAAEAADMDASKDFVDEGMALLQDLAEKKILL